MHKLVNCEDKSDHAVMRQNKTAQRCKIFKNMFSIDNNNIAESLFS